VIYFHLDPIDGASLGVAADLTRVQLNARLAPADDRGRALHSLYSSLAEALAQNADRRVIDAVTTELNRLLAAG
jgi:DNA-binding transcriptional regulator PaaX